MTPASRVALVTGAGRRVGRAIALAIGARGLHVVIHYNGSAEGAEETGRRIAAAGGSASIEQADLLDVRAAEQLVDRILQRHEGLAVLVNSAAIMVRTPVGEVDPRTWDEMFALNV